MSYNATWTRAGLGDAQSQNLAIGVTQAGLSTAAAGAVAAGLLPLSAVPFVGPALMVAGLGISLLIKNSGCGVTCVETSQWANQAASLLTQAANSYWAQPTPRSQSSQTLFLQLFDQTWAKLQQLCGQPGTGNAGVRCITDRQAGACTWRQVGTPYPGGPQPGECFNWFAAYRDPVANDPDVVPDSALQSVAAPIESLFQSAGVPTSYASYAVLALAALLLIGVVL